uniref:DMT family transporter n=2 Tax=unclassified Prevotella TaxID=2638335 RepID=A0AB33JQA4_9BACT
MKANTPALLRKGYATGIGSGMTWGLDAVMLSMAMAMTPFVKDPILLVGGTFICSMLHDVFAAFWMLIIMGGKGRLKDFPRLFKTRDGMYCALGALFGGPLAMTFYMMAIAKGGPALAATVTACYPLLGSVLAVFILKEKVQLKGWVGLMICIAGIIWIGYSPSGNVNINISQGILFALVAAIGWATEAVVCGYGMKEGTVDPQMALLIRELTSGVVYLIVIAPLMLGGFGNVIEGTKAVFEYMPCWLLILATALVGMSSFFMWYTSIDLIGAAKALCFNVTYAFWAVVFTFILIGSQLTWNIVIGSLLIISGVTLATLIHRKKTA